jgi:CYTH domain-containing protein
MGGEIERKFLVRAGAWAPAAPGVDFRRGYLSSVKERVVRVRTAGGRGFLAIKGITRGVTRTECEYEIPLADSTSMRFEAQPQQKSLTRLWTGLILATLYLVFVYFRDVAHPGVHDGEARRQPTHKEHE